MIKPAKVFNKFNRSHKDLRKFLRLVSYGCYHRTQFSRYKINPGTYDDFLRQMRFFIPAENIQVHRHEKFYYWTFGGNFRHAENYLYRSFLLKTIMPEHCLYDITVLQTLRRAEKLLTISEILELASEKIFEFQPETLEKDLPQTLRRRVNELENAGILKRRSNGKQIFYEQFKNPLGELSDAELKILSAAVDFYKNYSLIGTLGYFFGDTLKELYNFQPAQNFFLFKNNNFVRLLDDDILFQILKAVKNRQKILIERENKPPLTVTPLAIETDFLCCRQYIFALKDKSPQRIRVDKIASVTPLKVAAENSFDKNKNLREIRLRVKFKDTAEKKRRAEILNAAADFKIVEEAENFFVCAVEVEDPRQFYPYLWKWQPWAEILPGKDGLRARMKNDVEEVLKNYAEPV